MGSSLLGNFFIETDQKLMNFPGVLPPKKVVLKVRKMFFVVENQPDADESLYPRLVNWFLQ